MFFNKHVDLKELNFSKEIFLKFFINTKKHKALSQTFLTKQSHFYFDNESEEANRMSISMRIYTHESDINSMTKANASPKSLTNLEDQMKKTNNSIREKFSVHRKFGKKISSFQIKLIYTKFFFIILHQKIN